MKRIIFFITIWIGICFSEIGQISRNVVTKQSDLNIARIGEYDIISLDRVFYTTNIRLYNCSFKYGYGKSYTYIVGYE